MPRRPKECVLSKAIWVLRGRPHFPRQPSKAFKTTFMEWVRLRRAMRGHRNSTKRVTTASANSGKIAKAKLSEIDEPMIERLKFSRKEVSKTTANLVTVRIAKAL